MLLAIDTATPQVSVAFWDGRLLAERSLEPGRRHGESLAPAIADGLGQLGAGPADLTAVAVDVGPGLFTGLRVGLATAKAFASSLGLPAVGITSLELLAWPHRHEGRTVVAVVDARRKEVFRAVYGPGGAEVAGPAVCTPEQLAEELASLGPVLAAGDGALRYAEVLGGVEVGADAYPQAAVLAELAAGALERGEATDAAGLRPRYLRQADVRIGWEQRPAAGPQESGAPPTSIAEVNDAPDRRPPPAPALSPPDAPPPAPALSPPDAPAPPAPSPADAAPPAPAPPAPNRHHG